MSTFTKKDMQENEKRAILCYVCVPFLFSYIKKNESKYLKFHFKQGKTLFKLEIFYILILIFCNIFLRVDKICVHSKLGIEFTCGKKLPVLITLLLLGSLIYIIYNIIYGIKSIINKDNNKIPLIELKNSLFK